MSEEQTTNFKALRGKIVEIYGTIGKFADAFGITETQMQNKLSGRSGWSLDDVKKAGTLLNVADNPTEFYRIFFLS